MSPLALLFVCAGLALIGWLAARMRATGFRRDPHGRFGALPAHHGWFVALCTLLPPLIFPRYLAADLSRTRHRCRADDARGDPVTD